ncbi:MAG: ComEC/Rec2 family competence protein [Phycisphaeraceae bacterium]|nr:ComEC/Rec2 family competence protein [Phycisphaeraceae bacterium]
MPSVHSWADSAGAAPGRSAPARRSLVALAAFATGLVLARGIPTVPASAWFAVACGAMAAASALGWRVGAPRAALSAWACRAALVAAAVAFGAGWLDARVSQSPAGSLAALLATGDDTDGEDESRPVIVTIEGIVAAPARAEPPIRGALAEFASTPPSRLQTIEIAVYAAISDSGPQHASGSVLVRGPREAISPLPVGSAVRVTGEFLPIEHARNPGQVDRALIAAQEGIAGTITSPDASLLAPAELPVPASARLGELWSRVIWRLRSGAASALDAALADTGDPGTARTTRQRGVLRALLLGDYDPAAGDVTSAFTRQGLVHLLAISGFHLVVMAAVAMSLLRLLGDLGWLEPAITASLVLLYLLVVPAHAPVLRAGITVLAILLAQAMGRRYDPLSVLGWTAIALLLWRPLDLWSLGWQLSFGIVGSLLWLGRDAHGLLFGSPLKGTVPTRHKTQLGAAAAWAMAALSRLLATSLLCWAVAAPAIALHAGLLSPLAAVTGLVVLPLIVLMMWIGYAAVVLALVSPAAAHPLGSVLAWLADQTVAMVMALDSIPGLVVRLPSVSVAWTFAATGLALAWFRFGRTRFRFLALASIVVGAWFAGEALLGPRLAASGWLGRTVLSVGVLDVGDGSCTLIRSGSDSVLVDCGSSRTGIGEREIPRSLRALGSARVGTLVLTGSDMARVAGSVDLFDTTGVRTLVVGETFNRVATLMPGSTPAAVLRAARERGIRVHTVAAGDRIQLGRATLEIVSPARGSAVLDGEDGSLVVVAVVETDAGPRHAAVMRGVGDATARSLLQSGAIPHPDLLVLGTRTRAKEATGALLRSLGAPATIISTGRTQVGRRGASSLLSSLPHARVWTTARHGAIEARFDRDGSIGVVPLVRTRE